ncbi:Protein of unknown function [Amycolatopsis tolypomycina]|uniref:DUF3558 domain-containing protein n=1 Tax=Amycolatopsis tolypomycina TaxID=208445 RepID=A0A1H4JM17_9PSEU|nr:DUF3558 family protein [Amycolatopsis tolypomycina]SEB47359.1 Protein of unknown function [Amycolatopsis tolypomycina]
MANPIRYAPLAGLAVALVTAACTSPNEPPTPSGSAAPVPVTAAPLDVSRYLAAPCSGVPTELTAGLGVAEREDAHDTVLPGAGGQAQCRLSSGPHLTAAAEVRFYPTTRPLHLVTGPGSGVTTTSLDGYPAGEWVLSTGTDGSFTSCQMIVDIAQSQGIGILFNGRSGEPIATSCGKARQLAAGVIAPLRY